MSSEQSEPEVKDMMEININKATTLTDLVGEHILMTAPVKAHHPFDRFADGVAWGMDNDLYIIFEDPDDGYRSVAAPLICLKNTPLYSFGGRPNFDYIRRKVIGRMSDEADSEILELIDAETGHLWFRIGTGDADDYYPYFVNEWRPMDIEGCP